MEAIKDNTLKTKRHLIFHSWRLLFYSWQFNIPHKNTTAYKNIN